MSKYQLKEIATATNGQILSQPHQSFSTYSADSRETQTSCLFIPLRGENHDAHDYVRMAVENGCTGALVHEWREEWDDLKSKASFIKVNDTLNALQDFAGFWRQKFKATVIGLTGSNGKTTTKDFLSQLLQNDAPTVYSEGSFNNHWGVPFTLLKLDSTHKYCVVEMGMNHPGELTTLNKIVQPDVVVVLNVGMAHAGHFKSVDDIATAKEEIYLSAPARTKFVFNLDNSWTQKMFQTYQGRELYAYSIKDFSADVYLRIKDKKVNGYEVEGQINGVLGKSEIHFWGEQNIENLAAALCLASVSGMKPEKLWQCLEKCHTGWGRNQWLETNNNGKILFDGYNANPTSFEALINNLTPLFDNSEKVLGIFGEMLELGDLSEEEHKKLGEKLGKLSWQQLIFIGPSGGSFLAGWKASGNKINPIILDSYKESLDLDLPSMVNERTFTIIKGSRGGALERIVERLEPKNFAKKQ